MLPNHSLERTQECVLLEEIRDLHREEVRLRQIALEEQRSFQAHAEESLASARRKQRVSTLLLVGLLVVLVGGSFLGSWLLPVRGLLTGRSRGRASELTDTLIRSGVETATFDGRYSLDVASSFQQMRADRDAEQDEKRRHQLTSLLAFLEDQYRELRIQRGVIRSGGRLVQELSLTQARIDGDVLKGTALWHEDVEDPGDASHIQIELRLKGNRLELAFLDEDGRANEPIVFSRTPSRR